MAWKFFDSAGRAKTSQQGAPVASTHIKPMTNPSSTVGVFGANVAFLIPIENIIVPFTFTRMFYQVTTQSGNMDMGIYYSDDEVTFTRLFSTGSFAVPAGSANLITKTVAQQTLTPVAGRRWFIGWAVDNATAQFGSDAQSGSRAVIPSYTKATSFPLPASLTGMTGPNNPGTSLPFFSLAV